MPYRQDRMTCHNATKLRQGKVRNGVFMKNIFHNRLCFILCAALWNLAARESAAAVYTLTIQTNGQGSVTRNPTNSAYPSGSVVTITATPAAGWYFSAWTGDENSTANPFNVTMSSNKVITANFQPLPTYTLTTSTDGAGSISLDPPGGSYLSNSVVSATATPASGWLFLNWAGDASGKANPVAVTMNGNKAITAVFAQPAAIDQSPQNAIAEVGDTANFNVHAVGTAPLIYQWWFNNSKLAGATSTTLTLSNVQLNQEGTYSITVSNTYGAATNSATLTITNGCIGTNVVTAASEAELRNAMAIGGLVRCCFNGTITLSNTIDVTRDVILDAHARSVVISGNNAVRLFNVQSGVMFSATNLVFANGRNVGQGGVNPPNPGQGGAIFSIGGTVQLVSCALLSNSVTGGQGVTGGVGGKGQGGAIFLSGGSLLLNSVTVSSNMASGGRGASDPLTPALGGNGQGGAIYTAGSSVLILNCVLSNNVCTAPTGEAGSGGRGAAASGGALFQEAGSVTFTNSTLTFNQAFGIDSPTIVGPFPRPGAAYGGAIAVSAGTTTIIRCQMTSNLARGGNAFRYSGTGEAQGGAIYSSGSVFANDCSFAGNQALSGNNSNVNTDGRGGAIYNLGMAVLNGCSLISNLARGGTAVDFVSNQRNPAGHGLGGAIFNAAQFNMTNCTAALNLAQGGNAYAFFPGSIGGVQGTGAGGSVYNTSNGVFTAINVTIASNSVAQGNGWTNNNGFADGANIAVTNGTIWLRNSILAYPGTNNNAWGTITDAGYNMSSDGSANFNSGTSFNFTDPLLQALANNGGPTWTMALSPDSPAVDFGTSVGAPLTDQRGFPRPSGLGFDMGAYELSASSIQRPILKIWRAGNSVRLSFQAQAGATYILQNSTTLTNWTDGETIGPFGSDTQVNRTNNFYSPSIDFFRLRVQ
jgi:hypothetical protein